MVSGSKLMCPSKVSKESPLSLYYSVICSNCLGNVLIGMEKCVKMWKKWKMCWRPVFYILLPFVANRGDQLGSSGLHLFETLCIYPSNRDQNWAPNSSSGLTNALYAVQGNHRLLVLVSKHSLHVAQDLLSLFSRNNTLRKAIDVRCDDNS